MNQVWIPTDISSYTDGASTHCNHGTFASRTTTAGEVEIPWVRCPTDNIIDGLTYHQCLWYTRLNKEYCARFSQEGSQYRIAGVALTQPRDIGHACFSSLDS